MNTKLQELTDKIYLEGVEKGKAEADAIVTNARKEADAILAQLEAVEQSALTDRTIQNLVIEQGTSYVKGEQNLEETVNEITKKVNLYLAEQQ